MGTRALHFNVEDFISNGTAKTNLAILAFLYCGEIVETSTLADTAKREFLREKYNTEAAICVNCTKLLLTGD